MGGQLVVVDGPDGGGKSHAMQGLVQWAREQKLRVFDLREYQSKEGRIPELGEVSDFDVMLSCEPTLAWVGKVIKEEIIRGSSKQKYSGLTIAHAFALDRELLYRRIIIPALEAGKTIFQERGVITSLVYQPLQIRIPLTELMALPGNKLALKYAPSLIIICIAEPEHIIARLDQRPERQIFEEINFQRQLYHRYKGEWLQELFSRFGSKFAFIDTSPPKTEEDTSLEARRLWVEFLRIKPTGNVSKQAL